MHDLIATKPEPAAIEMPWIGRAEQRREDNALLRGAGLFVNDLQIPGILSVAFVRASRPGRIAHIDTTHAAALPGVHGVFTAADLQFAGFAAVNVLVENLDAAPLVVLADAHAHAVGQPVAAVVAETPYAAAAAAEHVHIDIRSDDGVAPGAYSHAWSGHAQAPEAAAFTVRVRVRHARVAAMPLEPRAAVAAWDSTGPRLTVWLATQTPHRALADLAAILGLPAAFIRVIAPDIGGSFGGKASIFPEDVFVAWAARRLGRAVRWTGSRAEDLLAGTHGRGLACEGHLAVAADGRMLALQAQIQAPLGHWMPFSAVVPGRNAARILPGPYRVPAIDIALDGRASRKAATGIYRGAGRPEAAMLMERLTDEAARRLDMDPVAFRRINLVPASAMPYAHPHGELLDSGDFAALLDRAVLLSQYNARRRNQAERRAAGALVGIGIGLYVEPCGQGWESARLTLRRDGGFDAATGSTAQGQGRETAFAQILADALQTTPGCITVRHGDTQTTPTGIGALASRSTGIGGSALMKAANALCELARPIAARTLGCSVPASIRLTTAGFVRPDASGSPVTWRDVAAAGATLVVNERFEAPAEAWSSGCCIAAVAIDPETMALAVEHITLVDDAGTVVNPMLVEGQLLGGVAQGIGEALYERIVYDDDDQLLTGSLMDYALPRACNMPPTQLANLPTRTPMNLLGAKGVGESGCIGVPAAIVNATVDALSLRGVRHLDMPLTAESLWRAVNEAEQTRSTGP